VEPALRAALAARFHAGLSIEMSYRTAFTPTHKTHILIAANMPRWSRKTSAAQQGRAMFKLRVVPLQKAKELAEQKLALCAVCWYDGDKSRCASAPSRDL
jgi:hypothetical protein